MLTHKFSQWLKQSFLRGNYVFLKQISLLLDALKTILGIENIVTLFIEDRPQSVNYLLLRRLRVLTYLFQKLFHKLK